MGYNLHITRADNWLDAQEHPIGRDEWNSYARRHPDIVESGWVEWEDIGREPDYDWPATYEQRCALSWRNGEVNISAIHTDYLPGLVAIAKDLHANLIGDDGERYTAEGTVD